MKLKEVSLHDAVIIVRSSSTAGLMSARLCKKAGATEGESLYLTDIQGEGPDAHAALGNFLMACRGQGNQQIDDFIEDLPDGLSDDFIGTHFISPCDDTDSPCFVALYINTGECWGDHKPTVQPAP